CRVIDDQNRVCRGGGLGRRGGRRFRGEIARSHGDASNREFRSSWRVSAGTATRKQKMSFCSCSALRSRSHAPRGNAHSAALRPAAARDATQSVAPLAFPRRAWERGFCSCSGSAIFLWRVPSVVQTEGRSVFGSSDSLPVFIFLADVCVVTISTMRTIFVARGMKFLAPFLGMFEVSIWLFAIGEVMKHLNDWRCSAAFAGGFTLGNFLGILLEEKLALGSVGVHMITHRDASRLIDALRSSNYGVTHIEAEG